MSELLKTPLNAWHRACGAKMAPFAGWDMPIQYSGIIAEHVHTRSHVSIFDICHMGEFILKGDKAGEALGRIVTQDMSTLGVGKCRYGFLLNDQGGVLDDLIVYRLGEDEYMLVVNGACVQSDFARIRSLLPEGLEFRDVSDVTAKIDLQGPAALSVLEKVLPQANLRALKYFNFTRLEFEGWPLLVSRTGYTGELGYEFYLPAEGAKPLWVECLTDERVKPAGLGARDTLRLEMGYPLYGQDLDTEHTPIEAGYERLVVSRADFAGKSGLARVRERLIPLVIPGRRAARHGDAVLGQDGTTKIGVVTSGSFSPSLGYSIALAYVAAEYAEEREFTVQAAKTSLAATRTELPFYTQGTAALKL